MNDAVDAVRARALAPSVAPTKPTAYLAVGVHLGFLLICASAVITRQMPDFPKRAWIAPILVGLTLLIAFAATRGRFALTEWGKGLLALGLGVAFGLTYDPQLANLPGLSGVSDSALGQYNPSLANVGVLLVLVFWGLIAATGGESRLGPRPFRRSAVISFVLIAATAVFAYWFLGLYYDLEGPFHTIDVMQKGFQYLVLILAAVGLSGGIGVRGWAHLYVGLALLAAFVRNLLVHAS
jgi:hypothetical protein